MTIKEKELQILKAYYDKRYNNAKIDVDSFELENSHEGAFYLANLERDGYLDFVEKDVFLKGGMRDEKYNNDVRVIWWEFANITKPGEQHLKENNLI